MCHASKPTTRQIPLLVQPYQDGSVHVYITLLVGKGTTKRSGTHRTQVPFPIGKWVHDPNFVPGSHVRCFHLASAYDVEQGLFSSYGSHRLMFLPSRRLYGNFTSTDACWHDGALWPLFCLDCEGLEKVTDDILGDPAFWRQIRALPPDVPYYPPQNRALLSSPVLDQLLLLDKILPAKVVESWSQR